MMQLAARPMTRTGLDKERRDYLRHFASRLRGPDRRAFQASMALKYCQGSPARAEKLFGWGREAVALGLNELRTGYVCYSARAAFSGNKLWEEKHPQAAAALGEIARRHSQCGAGPDIRHRGYPLTAIEAIRQLRAHGFAESSLPAISTMSEVLKRNGFRPGFVPDASDALAH